VKPIVRFLWIVLAVALAFGGTNASQAQALTSEAWRQDLEALVRGIETRHVDPFHTVSDSAWRVAVQDVHDRIPMWAPHEVIVAFMELATMIGDGHTVVVPPFEGTQQFHRYGVDLYRFGDGLFVRSAEPRYHDLVGRRVVRLGRVPVDSLEHYVARVFPHDNEIGLWWGLQMTLPLAEVLHALGIAAEKNEVPLQVEDETGARHTRMLSRPQPVTAEWLQTMLFEGAAAPDGWMSMRDPSTAPPEWLREIGTPYRYTYDRERRLLHVHFNQVRTGDISFDAFLDSLFSRVDTSAIDALILDLRTNEGGDLTMLTPMVRRLIAAEIGGTIGRLYVATGPRTFSAAGYLAARLDVYTDAAFVGEPTGTRPNFIGETDPFELPNSGLWANASTLRWQGTYAFDDRPWIEPDLPAPLTSTEYRQNRDPVRETVWDALRSSSASQE
jgi:hypothetical protein